MSIVFANSKTAAETISSAERTDEQLLLQYRVTGDESLFSELVHRYERELYSYLRRYLGNSEMAEDAFQAAFLQLHLKCDQFEEGRKLRPWLYMIATNKAIDLQRRNKRHQLISLDGTRSSQENDGKLIDFLEGDEASPLAAISKSERGRWVADTITELPEHLRVVVHLVYYQGLKYREAAEALSIPVGTVKSRLHTALQKLAESWKTTFDENDR
jgi:RNA polymerase sigma-70 factor (ECF subfamily)